jgi:hypothetical protein
MIIRSEAPHEIVYGHYLEGAGSARATISTASPTEHPRDAPEVASQHSDSAYGPTRVNGIGYGELR